MRTFERACNLIVLIWNYCKLVLSLFYIFYPFVIPTILFNVACGTKHHVHYIWSRNVCKWFRLSFIHLGDGVRAEGNKLIYLFNHRTLADTFLHDVILQGKASYLSRMMVGFLFWTALAFTQTVWLFRRGTRRNFDQFYQWLDSKFQTSPRKHLIVYPQGHRMANSKTPAPIKYGMLKYAYSRGIPVQICISFGNEKACCQNPPLVNRQGTRIYYSFGKVINPKQFQQDTDFIKVVQKEFRQEFYKTLQQYRDIQESY